MARARMRWVAKAGKAKVRELAGKMPSGRYAFFIAHVKENL